MPTIMLGPLVPRKLRACERRSAVDQTKKRKAKTRLPLRADPERLERAALHHLERYASSRANLERVLTRKVQRSARTHGTDSAEGIAAIAPILARLEKSGLLDDRLFAQTKARRLFGQGSSRRRIAAKLRQDGIAEALISETLGYLRETLAADGLTGAEQELAAAMRYAQRRRLGAFRLRPGKPDQDRRDLAALARQGFSLDIARKALALGRYNDQVGDYDQFGEADPDGVSERDPGRDLE